MVRLLASEVQQLLHNKFVVVLGDSVHRAVYKDLVLLLQKDCLLTNKQLRTKGELSFEKDQLKMGGELDTLHNRTDYREVREFCSDHHLVRFYFLTRVHSILKFPIFPQTLFSSQMNSISIPIAPHLPTLDMPLRATLAFIPSHLCPTSAHPVISVRPR